MSMLQLTLSILVLALTLIHFSRCQTRIPHVIEVDGRFPEMKSDLPWLLEFYAPWCGYCKKLAPIYDRVASDLDGTGIRVAKIDGTMHSEMAGIYEVHGFPTILFIKGSVWHVYRGDRTVAKLKQFAIRANSPAVHSFGSESAYLMTSKQKETFFTFVGDDSAAEFPVFKQVAENYTLKSDFFSASSSHLSQALKSSSYPAAFVVKNRKPYLFSGNLKSVDELSGWVNREMYGAFPDAEGAEFYGMMSSGKLLILVVLDTSSTAEQSVRETSERLRQEIMPLTEVSIITEKFQFVNIKEREIVSNIISADCPVPYLVIFEPAEHYHYPPPADMKIISRPVIETFIGQVVTKEIQPQGGNGIGARLNRMSYAAVSTAMGLWKESRVLFFLVVCMPCAIVALITYTLCCVSWEDEEQIVEEEEEEEEDVGHLKKE